MKNKWKIILFTIGAIFFGASFLFFLICTIVAISSDDNIAGVFILITTLILIPSIFFTVNVIRLNNNSSVSLKKDNEKNYKYDDFNTIFTYNLEEEQNYEMIKELVEHFKLLSFTDKVKVMNLIAELSQKE